MTKPYIHGGFELFPSPSVLEGLNPSSSPTRPPGFGTGHSLFGLEPCIRAISVASSPSILSSTARVLLPCAPSFSTYFRRRRLFCGCPSGLSPSANATLGAGHGRTCGKPTTAKLKKSVVANKEDVSRLRGWRCGGMMKSEWSRKTLNEWIVASKYQLCSLDSSLKS